MNVAAGTARLACPSISALESIPTRVAVGCRASIREAVSPVPEPRSRIESASDIRRCLGDPVLERVIRGNLGTHHRQVGVRVEVPLSRHTREVYGVPLTDARTEGVGEAVRGVGCAGTLGG